MFSKKFWMEAGERCLRAYLWTVLGVLVTAKAQDWDLNFLYALLYSGVAPAASVIVSMLSTLPTKADKDNGSLIPEPAAPDGP